MSTVTPLVTAAELVWRDFLPVLPEIGASDLVRVVVLDDDTSPDVTRALPNADHWRDSSSGSPAQVVLLTAVGATALDAPADDLPRLHVELSSKLQDLVMDARNSVWPVVRTTGGGSAVAEPVLMDGRACWAEHGKAVANIGQLADVIDSHG